MVRLLALIDTIIFFIPMLFQLMLGVCIYYLGVWFSQEKLKMYGKNLALAVDQNMNVVWLGDPDETISSRCGRAVVSGRPKWYIKYLLRPFVDWAARRFGDGPDHCIRSIEVDELHRNEVWEWQYRKQ